MRILQVCPYAWAAHGGVQTHVRCLTQHLELRGHEVVVLAPGSGGNDNAGAIAARPSVRIVGTSTSVPFNGSRAPICMSLRAAFEVRNLLDELAPDLVHVHEPFIPAVSLAAVYGARVPVVATFHAYSSATSLGLLYRTAGRLLSRIGSRLSMKLSVSSAAARYAAHAVSGPIQVIPNGVELSRYAAVPPAQIVDGRMLLFVGRLERRKGFDVAVDAFAQLARRFDDLSLVVVGEGPCRRVLDRAPAEIRRRIIMLGEIADGHLPSLYAAADVFLAPATGCESFGIVLLEAMASGRPIVATALDGYREVLRDGRDARLVPPGNANALAAATAEILDNCDLQAQLSASAIGRARTFSWNRVTDAVEIAYARAMSGGPEVSPSPSSPRPVAVSDSDAGAPSVATSRRSRARRAASCGHVSSR